MRLVRIAVAIAIAIGLPILTAGAAQAEMSGPCTANGVIKGVTYNPKTEDSIVIPRKGAVHWHGTVTDGSGKRAIDGKVYVKLPPPFGQIEINGSWGKSSNKYANSGTYKYNLPSVLAGPKFTVFGHHTERSVTCAGMIDVRIAGSKDKNPILIASLVLTVLALINFALIIRAKDARF